MVPAAFMMHTGRDHWEVLLRARAIENQCYVVAAGQIGDHEPGRTCFGRSMVIDPWGTVLAQAPDAVGIVIAEWTSIGSRRSGRSCRAWPTAGSRRCACSRRSQAVWTGNRRRPGRSPRRRPASIAPPIRDGPRMRDAGTATTSVTSTSTPITSCQSGMQEIEQRVGGQRAGRTHAPTLSCLGSPCGVPRAAPARSSICIPCGRSRNFLSARGKPGRTGTKVTDRTDPAGTPSQRGDKLERRRRAMRRTETGICASEIDRVE